MNQQLAKDIVHWNEEALYHNNVSKKYVSFVAKWIPRENKKFDWLHEKLVIDWFKTHQPYMFTTYNSYEGYYKSLYKCKMQYRKMVSLLNKKIDTIEIKLCSQKINEIVPENVPQIAFMKYKKKLYFDNYFDYKTERRTSCLSCIDIECFYNFAKFFDDKYLIGGDYEFNRSQSVKMPNLVPLCRYIKEAYRIFSLKKNVFLPSQNINQQMNLLNNQWKQMSQIIGNKSLKNYIPLVDMSLYENDEALYNAIGLGCLIAERSTLGKRILIVDHFATWINLEDCNDIFSMIQKIITITKSSCSTNYNLFSAIQLIIQSIEETKMTNFNIRNLTLVIFQGNSNHEDNIHQKIIEFFYHKGLNSNSKKHFPVPKIIYWNLNMDDFQDIPCNINMNNTIAISGSNTNLISNLHLLDSLHYYNSYKFICKILANSRYDVLDTYFDNICIR
jgi:hypothetical protein